MKYRLGVIGFGVMGQAIVLQAIKNGVLAEQEVAVYDLDVDKIKNCGYKVAIATSIDELIDSSDRLFFAVKPQHYQDIVKGRSFSSVKTIVTIMAGVKLSTLREKTSFLGGIVRVMPNTPCGLGKGICAYCPDQIGEEELTFVTSVLSACGDVVRITEDKFDAVTSVSGSGPAYVYMFAQGIIQGGINGGLSYDDAKLLALNTLIGAAELAKKSDLDLDTLIDRVCSKGGTTIQAVNLYREQGLTDVIAAGVDACRNRSIELSRG